MDDPYLQSLARLVVRKNILPVSDKAPQILKVSQRFLEGIWGT